MIQGGLAPRFRAVLGATESFIVGYPPFWTGLDLAPFDVEIAAAHRYDVTSLRSRDVVDGLHHLDALTFGDQRMLMPRWVLFDCGALPGVVYGFGKRAGDLPDAARAHYRVLDRDDVFVPLSMWVAIRAAPEGAWLGHNLSSANLLLDGSAALPGLGTLTKALGLELAGARSQYGATQWASPALALHLRFGDLHLLSAVTPAHTHEETLAYRLEVDEARLWSCLQAGWERPAPAIERTLDASDSASLLALHHEIEAGARWRVVGVERAERAGAGQRVHLCSTR
jgi:hypothetical protein